MSFVADIRTTTRKHITDLNEINQQIKDLESKKAGYYKPTYDNLMRDLVNKRNEIQHNCEKDTITLVDNFKKEINTKFAVKGEDLTPDAQLLSSGLDLNAADLESLFDKHSGNVTMQRLISEYAKKNDVHIARSYYGKADYLDAADTMAAYSRNALSRPEYADIMDSDEYFAQITPDALKG